MTWRFGISLLLAGVLAACAPGGYAVTRSLGESDPVSTACVDLFAAAEQAVRLAGVMDTQAARLPRVPYLRVNRFLASFREEVSGAGYRFWLQQLNELADEGWRVEIRNLPKSRQAELARRVRTVWPGQDSTLAALQECGDRLLRSPRSAGSSQEISGQAIVADNYQTWKRIVGLYPLAAWAFKVGICQWQKRTRSVFTRPLPQLPVTGQRVRYEPTPGRELSSHLQIQELLRGAADNPLAIPLPSAVERQLLFDRFAPCFEVDEASEEDRIGYPRLLANGLPGVEIDKPAVFRHLSHTRLGTRILLQLNYTIWFPSRPKHSLLDLFGGQLDGITWRVTLLPDGEPWIFDTIHNCGCYHLFFPTVRATMVSKEAGFAENFFVPQAALLLGQEVRPLVRIAASTHAVERVSFAPSPVDRVRRYQWADADELRSLPLPDGNHRSLFGQDGIVRGTERSERYLFWPAGIRAPGAMRQWGHHATAFVGRRHFDDARLFEGSFAISSGLSPVP